MSNQMVVTPDSGHILLEAVMKGRLYHALPLLLIIGIMLHTELSVKGRKVLLFLKGV